MSIKGKYSVRSIDTEQSKEWLLYKHYAHRIPSISYCFGLFRDNILCGVCSFGNAIPPFMKRSVCGEKYEHLVYELNRLVVNDNEDKNVTSYFVSQSIKNIPIDCIILSYADMDKGHHGYIYQATNFIYTGLSDKHIYWCVKGKEHLHERAILDEFFGMEDKVGKLKQKYGDENVYKVERSRKHRYIYFKGDSKFKNELLSNLQQPILPYPKGENKRYDASYKPTVNLSLF